MKVVTDQIIVVGFFFPAIKTTMSQRDFVPLHGHHLSSLLADKRQVGCLCAQMDHLRRILLFTDVYSMLDLFFNRTRRLSQINISFHPYLVLINRNIVRFRALPEVIYREWSERERVGLVATFISSQFLNVLSP